MKKKFNIILFSIILIITNAFAQNSNYLDSLKRLTTSSVDSVRFWAFSELVWELKYLDKKAALDYYQINRASTKGK